MSPFVTKCLNDAPMKLPIRFAMATFILWLAAAYYGLIPVVLLLIVRPSARHKVVFISIFFGIQALLFLSAGVAVLKKSKRAKELLMTATVWFIVFFVLTGIGREWYGLYVSYAAALFLLWFWIDYRLFDKKLKTTVKAESLQT